MLGTLIRSVWRNISGNNLPATVAAPGDSAKRMQPGAAPAASLREASAPPKNIDYEMVAYLMAAASSAEYMVERMMGAQNLVRREALLHFALDQCSIEGLVMEFGVYRGDNLRAIARRVSQEVHGFDSFEGLPEDRTYLRKQGRLSLEGRVPRFDELNVRVHRGWLDQTLPRFLAAHPGPARFVHVDCGIYASTCSILELLKPRIVSGTVIVFDGYLNYPAWREHEYKAFQQYVSANNINYRYSGFASSDCAVVVIVD